MAEKSGGVEQDMMTSLVEYVWPDERPTLLAILIALLLLAVYIGYRLVIIGKHRMEEKLK